MRYTYSMDYRLIETLSHAEFCMRSVQVIGECVRRAIDERGRCTLGVSGGSTPRPVYEAMGSQKEIDWTKVWLFLLDDRYVPDTHPESNQKLLWDSLLDVVRIPDDQVLLPDTSLQMDECVQQYEMQLGSLLRGEGPDIVVLGMGEDGHTASLFPPLPPEAIGDRLVIHTETDRFAVRDRISVTLQVLMNVKSRVLLLEGEKKKPIWQKTLATRDAAQYPVHALIDDRLTLVTQW